MAINVSVQYNGGILPDIILLTQCYHHRGTRLNAMKRFCLCSLSHPNVLTFIFPFDWGMLRRSRCVQMFLYARQATGCEPKRYGKVFGLQYSIVLGFEEDRRIGGGDQADIFNLVQNSQNISVRLKVDEEQWMIARRSKRQAVGSGALARYLSRLRHTHALHT